MNARTSFAVALACAFAFSLVACGDDDGSPTPPAPPLVEQDIDATGGTIALVDDGLRLEFPAGAVGAATTITVREASRAPEGVIGRAFEFGPSGTTFGNTVTVELDFVAGDLADATLPHELTLLTWNGSEWEDLGALVDVDASGNGTVTAGLQHFSTYAVARVNGANTYYGVFGFARDDIYAYGRDDSGDGLVSRWDGSTVGAVESLAGGRFFDGWGPSPTEHYALAYDGGPGQVLRSSDGTTWTQETTAPEALLSIHGNGAWRIAVGYDQTILEYDGTNWSNASNVPSVPGFPIPRPLHAVVVSAPGEAWAGGDDVLLQRTGGAWSLVDLSALITGRFTIRGLHARATDDVIAVGWTTDPTAAVVRQAFALRWDGTSWTLTNPTTAPGDLLNGVWTTATMDYAVGNRGTVMEGPGFLLRQTTDSTANLYDIWALDDTTVAFVGARGSFSYPEDAGNPGGGTGDCTGLEDYFLDFRASTGNTDFLTCGGSFVKEGFTVSLTNTRADQVNQTNDGCVVGGAPCADTIDGRDRGFDTTLFVQDCGVISIDLTAESGAVGCVEVDVEDFCSPEFCDGDLGSNVVAFLYDANGALIDRQGTLTGGYQTLTLDGRSARAARLEVRLQYGGLAGVRLYY